MTSTESKLDIQPGQVWRCRIGSRGAIVRDVEIISAAITRVLVKEVGGGGQPFQMRRDEFAGCELIGRRS